MGAYRYSGVVIRRRHTQRAPAPQAIDDWTGFKVDLSDLRKEWDGLLTVNPDRRNPQDFVRGIRETVALPYARPETRDRFIAQVITLQDGTPIDTEDGQELLDQGVVVAL